MSPEQVTYVASHFRALADAGRLRILAALHGGERTVRQVTAAAGLHQANTSKHLQLLHALGFVGRRRDGRFVYYRLTGGDMRELWEIARRRPGPATGPRGSAGRRSRSPVRESPKADRGCADCLATR